MPLPATSEHPSVESLNIIDEDLLENAVNIVDEEMPLPATNEHPSVENVNIVDEDLLENVVNVVDEDSVLEEGRSRFCFSVNQLIDTKYFEIAVGVVIIISSLALTFEDVQLQHRPTLQPILYNLHIIITVAFFSEMLLRCFGLGLRKYFNNPFRRFDFIIVVCCFINLITPLCGYQEIRVLKTVRILRLLRILPRKRRIIIRTLVEGIPAVCNALILTLIIWLPFALLGVRLFAGKYFKCVYTNGTKISFEIIPDFDACVAKNYTWQNSNMNFDNLGNAYLSLLQVATFEGWIQIVNDAVDSRGVDQQPIRDANVYMYLYFDVFIVIFLVFTLIVFIGIIYDDFRTLYFRTTRPFMFFCTENMEPAYNAEKKIKSCKPVKAIPRPQWKFQARICDTVQSRQFGMIFMLMIGLNMFTLTIYHYRLNETLGTILSYSNLIFLAIFTAECVLKMLAFRHHYFKDPLNLFELTINLLSTLALALPNGIGLTVATLSLLRIIRVVKIGRLLRQIKRAKNFRKLLFFTSMCFPTLFNIILLLFVIIFIFAIFGMSFFMHVKERSGLDDMFNFKTFGQSVMVLIQVSTLGGWSGVLDAISNEKNCKAGDCGDSTLGTAFLLSYLFITYLIIVMYFPAVCLHFTNMYDPNEIFTEDDYAFFTETWQQFDPDATSYIQLTQLSDFLDALEPPFRIRKPNKFKLIALDIPIFINERVYFTDVLQIIIADVFEREQLWFYSSLSLSIEHDSEHVSSTLYRQLQMHNARIIQKWWRKHRNNQYFRSSEDNEEPMAHETSVQVETDGITTKNGHVTKLHNRTPTFNSHSHVADL